MPEHDELTQRVLDLVERETGRAPALGTDLIAEFGLDSLDNTDLVMAVEDEFDLDIPDQDVVDPWKTPQAIVDYLVGRGKAVTHG